MKVLLCLALVFRKATVFAKRRSTHVNESVKDGVRLLVTASDPPHLSQARCTIWGCDHEPPGHAALPGAHY